ncbi:carbon storage regulator CsrA [Thermosediminibacter oceani]|uniref:Translational regulator CsrA n=1 Tax=Thermosediminibacter oceani (strain ATCC BAA-1034 / DSM 16646 / JW/IW-1228P) TaxID=555079 RepID=D9RYA9_THEOJ|nr:carbon storage regulator CsrA [Thermosediminibacter oceani]ADL08333.1 carbon storage regulator, CsrA [Thermosediminibacter oceani DSM 16646]
MLVLSRKKEEKILIGSDIVITIVDIEGDRVKLGINAPPGAKILRAELYEEIKEENRGANGSSYEVLKKLDNIIKK